MREGVPSLLGGRKGGYGLADWNSDKVLTLYGRYGRVTCV